MFGKNNHISFEQGPNNTLIITIDGYAIGVNLNPASREKSYEAVKDAILAAGFVFTERIEGSLRRYFDV